MDISRPKKNYRDSLFRRYFENPQHLAGIHHVLTGEGANPDDIRITTIKNVLFNNQKNDISYQIGNRYMVLLEHQSTINPNMPLRLLFYIAILYRRMAPRNLIYSSHQIVLPAPKFYVLYNGEEPMEDQILRLSTAFGENDKGTMELVVTLKNIRYNKENKLIQQYRPLHDYSYFVYGVETLCKAGHSLREAIELTAADCIGKDIMKDFLLDNYEEVFDMSLLRWNEKDAKACWQEEAREEGIEEGMFRGKLSSIKNLMSSMNLSAEAAMAALGIAKADYPKYMTALQ